MKEIFSDLYNNFVGSLNNKRDVGFSGRKLTAFTLVIVVIATHIKWLALGDLSNIENILIIDYSFIASLFGMTTYQSMKTALKTNTSTLEKEVNQESSKTVITTEQAG